MVKGTLRLWQMVDRPKPHEPERVASSCFETVPETACINPQHEHINETGALIHHDNKASGYVLRLLEQGTPKNSTMYYTLSNHAARSSTTSQCEGTSPCFFDYRAPISRPPPPPPPCPTWAKIPGHKHMQDSGDAVYRFGAAGLGLGTRICRTSQDCKDDAVGGLVLRVERLGF